MTRKRDGAFRRLCLTVFENANNGEEDRSSSWPPVGISLPEAPIVSIEAVRESLEIEIISDINASS